MVEDQFVVVTNCSFNKSDFCGDEAIFLCSCCWFYILRDGIMEISVSLPPCLGFMFRHCCLSSFANYVAFPPVKFFYL